jgi:xylulokinase
MNLVCFRNGSLAREQVRDQYGLDWIGFSRALESTPAGNNGALMLPWFEPEITPRVSIASVRRFDLDEKDAAANVRAVVEAQMMAMANHSEAITGERPTHIVASGGASVNRAILRVMADVFGCEVSPLAVSNTAALGAALRAHHADRLGEGDAIEWDQVVAGFTDPNPGDRLIPTPAHIGTYRELKQRYAGVEAGGRRS